MTDDISRPLLIPASKKEQFRQLTSIPSISWPVVIVAIGGIVASVSVIAAAVMGQLSYWVATPLLTFIYYWFFAVIHDGAHRSIAKNKTLNDFIAQAAITTSLPYANLELLRWAHMEHHRFTNDKDKDPDYWSHGKSYTLPLRWALIDVMYLLRLFNSNSPQKPKLIKNLIPYLVFGAAVIGGLIWAGFGMEYLLLSLLPSRLMFIGIGFTFFWLPHNHWSGEEDDFKQVNNYSMATSIREGKESLMNILLQYQNYHLVHHMWPTTPFYNNEKVFRLLEPEFRQRDLVVAKDYAIFPEIHKAA
jgi:beta-carotene hydroxylase